MSRSGSTVTCSRNRRFIRGRRAQSIPLRPDRGPPEPRRPDIPVAADFLRAALEQFGFVPQRPDSEIAFKRAYAKVAAAAGLSKEQVVRIYAFETGGNGTYDAQAGLVPPRPGARAISPAIGYNQLLSTNSVGLMAVHGDRFLDVMRKYRDEQSGGARPAMAQKIEAVQRMIAFSRTVPNLWSEHDQLAKNTPGGNGHSCRESWIATSVHCCRPRSS